MEEINKVILARIKLQKVNPFFSYICQHLKLIEKNDMPMPTIAVNKNMELFYDKKFVNSMEIDVLVSILTHEVSHVILFHPERVENFFKKQDYIHNKENHNLMNICLDAVCNDILVNCNINIPEKINNMKFIVPYNHTLDIGGYTIKNINKKSAEDIFIELTKHLKKEEIPEYEGIDDHTKMGENGSSGKKGDEPNNEGKDSQKSNIDGGYPKESVSKSNNVGGMSHKEISKKLEENKKYIQKLIVEAATFEKMNRGTIPAGLERIVGKILEPPKIYWRAILKKYISSQIPGDFTYSRPSKKSFSTGFYLPATKKEGLDVVIAIDTSGSINKKDLKDFLSEIVGISKSFNNINMRIITADCKIYDDLEVSNGNIKKIKNISIKGGGGTSHTIIFDYLKEKYPKTKLLVALTDAYSDIGYIKPKNYNFETIWAITKGGCTDIPFGKIIKIE